MSSERPSQPLDKFDFQLWEFLFDVMEVAKRSATSMEILDLSEENNPGGKKKDELLGELKTQIKGINERWANRFESGFAPLISLSDLHAYCKKLEDVFVPIDRIQLRAARCSEARELVEDMKVDELVEDVTRHTRRLLGRFPGASVLLDETVDVLTSGQLISFLVKIADWTGGGAKLADPVGKVTNGPTGNSLNRTAETDRRKKAEKNRFAIKPASWPRSSKGKLMAGPISRLKRFATRKQVISIWLPARRIAN